MIAVVERTLALLALVALATAVLTAGALVTRRVPVWLRDEVALPLATAIAAVATAGSLYLSEIAGYVPCTLCWYQRIAMYPLVVILGVAAWRRDATVWLTALPLTVIGGGIAIWHVAIERNPGLGGVCDVSAPCSLLWVNEFGFLTLPTMALIGFVTIGLLTLAARPRTGAPEAEAADHAEPADGASPPNAAVPADGAHMSPTTDDRR